MERQTSSQQTEHIDVVNDFVYNSRNHAYNEHYRKWRQTADSPYLYRYVHDQREHAYMEGTGFAAPTAPATEQKTLRRVSEVVGFSLLAFLLCQLGCGSLLVWVLNRMDMDIRLDFLTFSMKGSQWLVIGVQILVMLLQYGSALLIANRFFRIPIRVRVPFTTRAFPEGVAAVGFAMICAALFCVIDHLSGQGAESAQQLFSYKNTNALMVYGAFDIIATALLHELLMRGTLLPMLRQFGDRFAVCTIAVLAFLFPNTTAWRIGAFCIGLASGYILLKGGSFLYSVMMHVIYHALIYARLILVYHDGAMMSLTAYVLLLTGVGIAALGLYIVTRRGSMRLENRHTYLPTSKKLLTLTETITMLPWIAFSLIFSLVQMFG